MKILSVSDVIVPFLYSPQITERFLDVDCVIGCGDLPYYYQEYIVSSLNVPLFFVHGNHDPQLEYTDHGEFSQPRGGVNLHQRAVRYRGMLLAGVEGSVRYSRRGLYQHTQRQMWYSVFSLAPLLMVNRARYGRYLDIFVTHASPWGIHDQPDHPHVGIKAFRWFLTVFKPQIHLHGHIHVYRPDTVTETLFGETRVINTYGYKLTQLELPGVETNPASQMNS